jgi:hypothetical protein
MYCQTDLFVEHIDWEEAENLRPQPRTFQTEFNDLTQSATLKLCSLDYPVRVAIVEKPDELFTRRSISPPKPVPRRSTGDAGRR